MIRDYNRERPLAMINRTKPRSKSKDVVPCIWSSSIVRDVHIPTVPSLKDPLRIKNLKVRQLEGTLLGEQGGGVFLGRSQPSPLTVMASCLCLKITKSANIITRNTYTIPAKAEKDAHKACFGIFFVSKSSLSPLW